MKTTVYKSKKGSLLIIINSLMLITLIAALVFREWPAVVIFGLANCMFLWLWLDTYCIIKDDQLFYKCAFVSGSVPISTIHEIEKHTEGIVVATAKASLAMKGLVIKYNRWDDLFVSPQNEEQFIAELQ